MDILQNATSSLVSIFSQGIPVMYHSGQTGILVGTQPPSLPTTVQVEEAHR